MCPKNCCGKCPRKRLNLACRLRSTSGAPLLPVERMNGCPRLVRISWHIGKGKGSSDLDRTSPTAKNTRGGCARELNVVPIVEKCTEGMPHLIATWFARQRMEIAGRRCYTRAWQPLSITTFGEEI
jgi:hypothetical protein